MTTVAEIAVSELKQHPAWLRIKTAATALQGLQAQTGAIERPADLAVAGELVLQLIDGIAALAPQFPHDAGYLDAVRADFRRWAHEGFGVPDFYDSLMAFQPQRDRVDGLTHLVVFPMYTQNGSRSRLVEAVLVQVIWPDFVARAGGRRLQQQAVRADPLPRLHRRLRHQLGGALSRDRRHAADPDLHLGCDLRRP